jgi:hypothetical protein
MAPHKSMLNKARIIGLAIISAILNIKPNCFIMGANPANKARVPGGIIRNE